MLDCTLREELDTFYCGYHYQMYCQLHSPKHGSVTSASLTLPVPALQVHILGVPPAEVLLEGQAVHSPEEG